MIDILLSIIDFVTKKPVYGPIITVIFACIFYKIVSTFIRKIIPTGKDAYETKKRKTITDLFINISKYTIVIFSCLVIMSTWGINVKGLIAGLGITATILGLALQDTFKDIINGIKLIRVRRDRDRFPPALLRRNPAVQTMQRVRIRKVRCRSSWHWLHRFPASAV